jgi:transketolase
MIVARTQKGHGVSFLADVEGWHGKPLPADEAAAAIEELGGRRDIVVTPPSPEAFKPVQLGELTSEAAPSYSEGIATRKAFGQSLAWLAGHRPDLVVLDGEVGNSTYTDDFEQVAPERFFQMYIAEQTMVGAQVGLQALGKTAFSSTFGAFYTRAQDFVRMAAIGRANLRLCGSHAGISIGEDGPSQMALEDLACMRAVHGSTVLYPADGNATVKMVTAMCDLEGISYLRTTREQTPMLYGPDEEFPVGGSKTLRSSPDDRATIVAAGITLVEALGAADALEAEGVRVRVIDLYCVKPVDAETLRTALIDTGVIVTVEDHWAEGGIGDAVLDALASAGDVAGRIVKVAPREMPGSGAPKELRDWAGISADRIAGRVRDELTLR